MLRGLWVRCVLLVMTVLLATPVVILVLLVPRWSNVFVHVGRWWSRTMLAATGARVTYHGLEHALARSPCVFIANHQSIVDIWVMLTLIPSNARFVAKQELFRIPIFGWALSAAGCVPINRGNRAKAIGSLRVAAQRIRDGCSVVLFPEGSRSRDGTLGPFKKGAFHLAIRAGVPVVPVAITGSFDVFPPRRLRVTAGPVEAFVEPPVDVAPFSPEDHRGLASLVRDIIERRFQDASPVREGGTRSRETS